MTKENTTQTAYVDGRAVVLEPGESILSLVRREAGNQTVPTLCDAPNLEAFGACRVCSVEVAQTADGARRTVASCHTPVSANTHIFTNSQSVRRLRKNIVELVLTDHPLDCLTCEVNGNCELQDVAAMVGIRDVRYADGETHTERKPDTSHPYMTMDMSKCINCYRCIRACDEVQGQFVLTMEGRGFDSRVVAGMGKSFSQSGCVSCGACSQACPTSAISDVYQSKAKLEDKTRTTCTYCGVGCNLDVAKVGERIHSIQAPFDAAANGGHTCVKGRFAFEFYDHPERLRTPLVRKAGKLTEATWDEAYERIVSAIQGAKDKYGSDSIAGISSARCTNEENYLMQKFIRAVVGTNNIDGCARVCHSPTALGMQRTFGTGAATNSIEDIADTDCLLIIGANPTDAHPVTGAKMKQAAIRGKTLIVIDPRKTEMARYADHHIALRPGTNVAVLNMMIYFIIEAGLDDDRFVESRTEGFAQFKKSIMDIDVDEMATIAKVDKQAVKDAALAYAAAGNAMSFHGLGVTEHSQGTFAVQQIANLAMLTGNIGRRGVGVNPLRGQNNVQGSADMGVQPHQGAGYLDITSPDVQEYYHKHYGTKVPTKVGYKIPEMFEAALDGKLKVLWLIGEDVVQTDPNSKKVAKALEALDLLVVQELFLTETAKLADVVLPGASFLEKSGTFTNGERRIQQVNAVVPPIGNSKVDGQIIIDVMNRMGYQQPDYNAAQVLAEVSRVVPFFAGVTWERLEKNGLQWPVSADGTDSQVLHQTEFKRGKGFFQFSEFQESQELLEHQGKYPFILTTNRVLEHYNCGAMTRRTHNVELSTHDVLLIHPSDAASKGIQDGDLTCVSSPRGKIDLVAQVTEEVNPGVLSTTFHFPEVMVNDITSDVHDSEAKCPEYKVVAVDIRKSKGIAAARAKA